MINPETVSEAFIKFLEEKSIGTFGTNIFLSQVPLDAPDTCFWILTSGGATVQKLKTGERVKQYFTSINYRSDKAKNIERDLFSLEELLNCAECVNLEGFEILEIDATQFPSDEDLDNEDRRVGLLQASVSLYKTC